MIGLALLLLAGFLAFLWLVLWLMGRKPHDKDDAEIRSVRVGDVEEDK